MDQLLLENHELINKIKKEYDKILKENKLLKEKIIEEEITLNLAHKENFSKDGIIAVNELIELLKQSGFIIKPRDKELWYKIYNKESNKCLVIENYNKGRTYHGLITTYYHDRYLEKDINIINLWEFYGRSKIRKQFDYRGKNKKIVLNLLTELLT